MKKLQFDISEKEIQGYTIDAYLVEESTGIGYKIAYLSTSDAKTISKTEPTHYSESSKEFYILAKSGNIVFSRSKVIPMMCAYNSSEDYLGLLGTKLYSDDKTWYQEHPLTEANGLPYEHTLTVLSQLVAPYQIGISKVMVLKNSSISEEMKVWQEILGINPVAIIDRSCSNTDYINMLAGDDENYRRELEEEVKNYRFEYVDKIEPPAIFFDSSAAKCGHASFGGPRAKGRQSVMGIRYDWLTNIKYHKPVPEVKYKETDKFNRTVNFWESKASDGRTFRQLTSFISSIGTHLSSFISPSNTAISRGRSNATNNDEPDDYFGRKLPEGYRGIITKEKTEKRSYTEWIGYVVDTAAEIAEEASINGFYDTEQYNILAYSLETSPELEDARKKLKALGEEIPSHISKKRLRKALNKYGLQIVVPHVLKYKAEI